MTLGSWMLILGSLFPLETLSAHGALWLCHYASCGKSSAVKFHFDVTAPFTLWCGPSHSVVSLIHVACDFHVVKHKWMVTSWFSCERDWSWKQPMFLFSHLLLKEDRKEDSNFNVGFKWKSRWKCCSCHVFNKTIGKSKKSNHDEFPPKQKVI